MKAFFSVLRGEAKRCVLLVRESQGLKLAPTLSRFFRARERKAKKERGARKKNKSAECEFLLFLPLPHYIGSPVPEPKASWQSSPDSPSRPFLAVLSWLPCPGCPVPAALSALSCPRCSVPAVLARRFCPRCPVPAILSWLSSSGCPIPAVLS
jgi:hypothetical protein